MAPSAAPVNSVLPTHTPTSRRLNEMISSPKTQLLTHLIALQLWPRAVPSKLADNPAQQHWLRLGPAVKRRGNHTPQHRRHIESIHSSRRCCLSESEGCGTRKQPHQAIPLHPSVVSIQTAPNFTCSAAPKFISDFNRNNGNCLACLASHTVRCSND